jgi:hypothetical protein
MASGRITFIYGLHARFAALVFGPRTPRSVPSELPIGFERTTKNLPSTSPCGGWPLLKEVFLVNKDKQNVVTLRWFLGCLVGKG